MKCTPRLAAKCGRGAMVSSGLGRNFFRPVAQSHGLVSKCVCFIRWCSAVLRARPRLGSTGCRGTLSPCPAPPVTRSTRERL